MMHVFSFLRKKSKQLKIRKEKSVIFNSLLIIRNVKDIPVIKLFLTIFLNEIVIYCIYISMEMNIS